MSEEQQSTEGFKPPRRRKFRYLYALTRTMYQVQKMRIAATNRINALANTCCQCGKRIDSDAENKCQCDEPEHYIKPDEYTMLNALIAKTASEMERAIEKPIKEVLKDVPIFDWLARQKGIGTRLGASIIALTDPISDFLNISKYWAYAGLHTVDGKGVSKNNVGNGNWNRELHMVFCGKFPDQVLKLGFVCTSCGRPVRKKSIDPKIHCICESPKPQRDSFYGRLYDKIKAFYQAKYPEPVETDELTKDGRRKRKYTPKHIENMTRRKLAKMLAAHVWLKWREAEGLSTEGPWIIEHGGHSTFIEPPE